MIYDGSINNRGNSGHSWAACLEIIAVDCKNCCEQTKAQINRLRVSLTPQLQSVVDRHNTNYLQCPKGRKTPDVTNPSVIMSALGTRPLRCATTVPLLIKGLKSVQLLLLGPRLRHQEIQDYRTKNVGECFLQPRNSEAGGLAVEMVDLIVQFCFTMEIRGSARHILDNRDETLEIKEKGQVLRSCDISSLITDSLCDQARGRDVIVTCFYYRFAVQKEQSLASTAPCSNMFQTCRKRC